LHSFEEAVFRQMIKRAMEAIESVSCIKFKERLKKDSRFIKIVRATNGELCYSTLGRSNGKVPAISVVSVYHQQYRLFSIILTFLLCPVNIAVRKILLCRLTFLQNFVPTDLN
jgi:hypothetical protein